MKKLFASVKFFKLLCILTLSLMMVTTTAVSFAYWNSGIESSSDNKDLSVIIGSGNQVSMRLNLTDAESSNSLLIPKLRTASDSDTTTKLTFVISVAWIPSEDVASTPYGGKLAVNALSLVFNEVDMIDEKTFDESDLFVIGIIHEERIDASNVDGTINKVEVTITVELNEPEDSVQYFKIAGQNGILTLLFEVESDSETA